MPEVRLTAWRFIVGFGTVSLLADFVYEGARSVTGPLLASLGATALVVGIVTGVGEAAALVLRLVSGPLADRTRAFWSWTIAGYALSVLSVPLLGVAGTLWAAGVLVVAERVGKAVRSPAKDTLLSFATASAGRGRGFGVHEAMDQVGALLGPLVVAVLLAVTDDDFGIALGALAAPAVAVLALLVWLRGRVPDASVFERPVSAEERPTVRGGAKLPREFWVYSLFSAVTMVGFATFGVLSFHLVADGIVSAAAVPIVYVVAMAADAVAAVAVGVAYDRIGPKVLLVLPILSASVPVLGFADSLVAVTLGAVVWGAAVGVQESTLRAVVADLVDGGRRATAYGLYAAAIGVGSAIGGTLTGWLYDVGALVPVVIVVQAVALALFVCLRRFAPMAVEIRR